MRADPEPDLWPAATTALRGLLLAAAWRVRQTALDLLGEVVVAERFAFVEDYAQALAELPDESPLHPGLQALAEAAQWSLAATELWLLHGLADEDRRFAGLIETLNETLGETGEQPGAALLQAWFGNAPGDGLRPALRVLIQLGLLRPVAAGGGRAAQRFEVDEACWAALRGTRGRTFVSME